MPDLLLELLSEEIPARMQGRAADDLRRLVTDALVAQGLLYEGAQAYATPRRLALHVVGLPASGKDVREERRGPRVGAADAAVVGFLKSVGLASADQLRVVSDPKKGDSYVAVVERPGRPTPEVLSELLPDIIRAFPWPKSMRWGAASGQPGSLRWVRPLQSILCTFGSDTEAPEIVPVEVDGIVSGDATRGHRFMAPGPIRVRRFDDYAAALAAAKVVLDAERRRDVIRHDARDLAFAQGLEVVEDEALLDEVAGLVEWPVALMGSFDESFLDIPPEVIRATIRANQKCFVLRASRRASGAPQHDAVAGVQNERHPEEARSAVSKDPLSNRFILVANIEASDDGAAIVAGNERVVRARLSDAKFFWDTDRKTRLEDRLDKLRSIVFHEKLGTQYERVDRIAALARELAPNVGADPDLAERAARLAKADLTTEMVGEFPELQGLMGRYYAAAQGEHPSVAAAIEEHYRPLGPSDRAPTDPVSVAVALADKLDTLVGFWAIDEKPTGSKDPYALRRAALGVIRLVLENGLRLAFNRTLCHLVEEIWGRLVTDMTFASYDGAIHALYEAGKELDAGALTSSVSENLPSYSDAESVAERAEIVSSLQAFFHDRLKVYLRERGARHDLIDAVLNAGADHLSPPGRGRPEGPSEGFPSAPESVVPPHPDPSPQGGGERAVGGSANDDLLLVVRRVEALGRLLDTEDGRNLLAATKRAANILRIEEKKDGRSFEAAPDLAGLVEPEERALAAALARASAAAAEAIGCEDFEGAMLALSGLRPTVDAFFERVTVNAEDPALRVNRLKLLAALRRATLDVADFSKIEG